MAHSLELAAAAGLIDLDANDVRFRHPLVRSAIAQGASAADRRAAHAALATVLGDQHDRRAWHLAASVLGTDEKIAAELESAAGRAERRGANDAAVAALERAAELSADPGVRGRRLMRASDLAFEFGRRDLLHRLLERAELLDLGEVERGRVTWIKEMTAQRILGTEEIHSLVDVAERARKLGDRDLAIDLVWLVAQRCYWSAPADEARARVLEAAAGAGLDRQRPAAARDGRLCGAARARTGGAGRGAGGAGGPRWRSGGRASGWNGRGGRRRVRARRAGARGLRDRAASPGPARTPREGARPGGMGRQPSRRLDARCPGRRRGWSLRRGGAWSRSGRRERRSCRRRSLPGGEISMTSIGTPPRSSGSPCRSASTSSSRPSRSHEG